MKNKYLIQNRLEDVIALIQILAMDPEHAYRTSNGLNKSIGEPGSVADKDWLTVAKNHGEFFRTTKKKDEETIIVVLLARYSENPKSPAPLDMSETKSLIDAAIEIHKNQLENKSINKVFGAALISILLSVASIAITLQKDNSDSAMQRQLNQIESKIDKVNSLYKPIPIKQDSIK